MNQRTNDSPLSNVHRARLARIAVWLENGGMFANGGLALFDMGVWRRNGDIVDGTFTIACIGGYASLLMEHDHVTRPWWRKIIDKFRGTVDYKFMGDWLGLDSTCARHLFCAIGRNAAGAPIVLLRDIDAAWAARCIRKLIDTGVVDWAGTRYTG